MGVSPMSRRAIPSASLRAGSGPDLTGKMPVVLMGETPMPLNALRRHYKRPRSAMRSEQMTPPVLVVSAEAFAALPVPAETACESDQVLDRTSARPILGFESEPDRGHNDLSKIRP
jgi:hypothetical protein